MKKITKADINHILNREIEYLSDGVTNSLNPYHFFYLSTLVSDSQVSSRTIVLRKVAKNPLSISFNADYRSPKVKQLLNNTNCLVLFYDNKRKMQLRADCKASINYENKITKDVWRKTPLQSRKCYMGEYNPSDSTSEWQPNIPLNYLKTDPDKDDSESGYKNFTVIELSIDCLDILELHHDGHVRFKYDPSGEFSFIAP